MTLPWNSGHWAGTVPPWTVTRAAWNVALRPSVSGIAMDVMLFHQHSGRLVHRYCIFADPLPHMSLRVPVMSRLAIQALAMARWAITSDWTPHSTAYSHLVRQDHRASEYVPPAWGLAALPPESRSLPMFQFLPLWMGRLRFRSCRKHMCSSR